jgi:hypothetical protein
MICIQYELQIKKEEQNEGHNEENIPLRKEHTDTTEHLAAEEELHDVAVECDGEHVVVQQTQANDPAHVSEPLEAIGGGQTRDRREEAMLARYEEERCEVLRLA